MTQRELDLFGQSEPESEVLIAAFRAKRQASSDSEPTIAAEVSQLRSLVKDAYSRFRLRLADLLTQPEKAAELIEAAGNTLGRSTVQTRIRAVQKLAMINLGEIQGKRWIASFRASLPKRPSRGWHDEGISLPGTPSQPHPHSPTPDPAALETILHLAVRLSQTDAAIAGLACFSGLELDEICGLRWKDVRWTDQRDAAICEVRVQRRGQITTCLILPIGAKPLLSLALASGFQRDAFLFPGRQMDRPLSKGAIRNRLKRLCLHAGWPRLSRTQLCAAFVMWLRGHGYDDHSIRLIIGRRRAATIDRLLRHSTSIAAQLRVDDARQGKTLDSADLF